MIDHYSSTILRKHCKPLTLALLTAAAMQSAVTAQAAEQYHFNRIASFPVAQNLPADADPMQATSAEIITISEDGNTLIYSDSPLGGIGMVDIKDAKHPKAAGFVDLDGEPTGVATAGDRVLSGVNTSASYTQPAGYLAAINIADGKVVNRCDLGGQPDSVAVSKDGRFAAVAIENERDEDLNDGALPQLPAGYLSIVALKDGVPVCHSLKNVDLTGLAEIGGSDPEPEFVDFNGNNEIVVTLQENNHLVIVDAATGKIVNHFSAGSTDLDRIDIKKDGALTFNNSLQNVLREPDAVKWLDNERFVIANEGDMNGGARGFTIFHKNGKVLFESGASFEHEIVKAGHYPDKRSGKKGAEPEGLAVGSFNGQQYIFVLSERASVIGVYKDTGAAPEFVQLLPSGIAPESAVTFAKRNLLASANEKDLVEDGGSRAHVMLYELSQQAPGYPQIVSDGDELIGWGALSGLAADAEFPGQLYAVNDSFYKSQPSIFKIDATQQPAVITDALRLSKDGKPAKQLDLEGIAVDGKGGFWLASEGNSKKDIPHAIYHANALGEIDRTIAFPAELLQHERRFGAEGITQVGNTLWIAIQRPWQDDADHSTKLLAYNLDNDQWGAVHYPLEKAANGWVGLSEITAHGDAIYVIERDNQIGEAAKIKRLYQVGLDQLKPAPLGSTLPLVEKTLSHDFMPQLKAMNGYVTDKVEGFAIDANGQAYALTDNDGVDDSSGETFFFKVKSY